MIIRGTPKDIERYIKVYDKDNIYKLNVRGLYATYIDDECAYFEYNKDIVRAIVEIIQELNEGV